ncbi:hypothetical protein LHK_01263 [Laribacter hongkongensis HLHK9]|uniref:Uncharacterized protein n=1 Tax=Laribacter hongkongensis (strain HLHK9) TaxID=557598 RepID=C1D713_LARHH|nr:hypothetical protein LHK_01263 [Laribacter hongkongensis HLHK9]
MPEMVAHCTGKAAGLVTTAKSRRHPLRLFACRQQIRSCRQYLVSLRIRACQIRILPGLARGFASGSQPENNPVDR